MRAFPLSVLTAAVLAAPAHAAWLKIGFAAQMSSSTQQLNTVGPVPLTSNFASASGFFTFDTDAGPIATTADTIEFEIQDFEVASTTMIGAISRQRRLNPTNASARMIYSQGMDILSIRLLSDADPAYELVLQWVDPNGAYNLQMTSLPDNTGSYGNSGSISSVLTSDGSAFQAIWLRPNNVFVVGAIQYITGGTAPPAPRPCSPADFAAPFGILNFFDLTAYLDELNAGCP